MKTIDELVEFLNNKYQPKYWKFGYEEGKKYWKVINIHHNHKGEFTQRCSYAFIDKITGDIYRAASWKGPAKHVRGNMFNNDLDCCGEYGVAYLK